MGKTKKKTKKHSHRHESFFEKHPRIRILLGLFIVSVAFMVGMIYRSTMFEHAVMQIVYEEEGVYFQP